MNKTIEQSDERAGLPSASEAPRFMRCPPSIGRSKHCPPAPATDLGVSGTRIHAAVAGEFSPEHLDEAEIEIFNLLCKLWRQTETELGLIGARTMVMEERLWLHDETTNPIMSAKPDLIIGWPPDAPTAIAIVEWKTGSNAEPANLNWQLRAQAVCFFAEYGDTLPGNCDGSLLIQVQARGNPQVTWSKFNRMDAADWRRDLTQVIAYGADGTVPGTPSSRCEYCPALHVCAEASSYLAVANVKMAPSQADLPNDDESRIQRGFNQWTLCSPRGGVEFIRMLRLVGKLRDRIEEHVRQILERDPDCLPGLRLGTPLTTREVADVGGLAAKFPEEVMAAAQQINLGRLEIAYANYRQAAEGKKITKTCPDKMKAELDQMIEPFITRKKKAAPLIFTNEE